MRAILGQLIEWSEADILYAVAMVVGVSSSTPREPGTAMAVTATGEVVGSISGGCVEAAVVDMCSTAIRTGLAQREEFGISDDDLAVGLTCGGTIDVFVVPATAVTGELLRQVAGAIDAGVPTALTTVLSEGCLPAGTQYLVDLDQDCHESAASEVFVHRFTPDPRMIICGAMDFADALSRVGKLLGYHVIVCDARPTFATAARFPAADEIVVDWPHRYLPTLPIDGSTVLCVLSHDPKFELPLLEWALRQPFGYIGAMGSRIACADRAEQLRARGLTDELLARLRAPIGLDLGGRTPAETAVSIAAEIIASRSGRDGAPLRDSSAAIHPRGSDLRVAGRVDCIEHLFV